MRAIMACVLAVALATMVACGGTDSSDQTANPPTSDGGNDSSNLFEANPVAALGASADRLEQEVQSLRATFTFEMSMAEFEMGMEGDFAFQAPDQLYMDMNLSGTAEGMNLSEFGSFEILVLGRQFYVKMPVLGGGWFVMSFDDLGVDSATFEDLLESHSPLDFRAMVERAGAEVKDLGSEDGERHLRATVNIADLMDALLDSFDSAGSGAGSGFPQLDGPLALDIWIDEETMLPSRMAATGEFDGGDDVVDFSMTMEFEDYNGSVDIPSTPEDAKSFSEMFGGFDLEGGEFDTETDTDGDGIPDFFDEE